MTGISYGNYSFNAGMSKYQAENSKKGGGYSASTAKSPFKVPEASDFSQSCGSSVSEIKRLGYSVSNDKDVFGDTWNKVDQLPGAYELKDSKAIGWIGLGDDIEFRFFHAAESSEDNPVLVARGVDENGNLFEQKIVLNEINPYNATNIEIHALTTYYKKDFIIVPLEDFYTANEQVGNRFDFISGLQDAVHAYIMNGFYREARGLEDELGFLLSVTKNASPNIYESSGRSR